MFRFFLAPLTIAALASSPILAQEAAVSAKPTAHVLGTITAMDAGTHTVTVKDDKSGTTYSVDVTNTKTLLKVAPGAKDVKSATRMTADQLAIGDRVDVRGSDIENSPNAIAAKSVVLMSARDLAQAHQAEATAWQNSISGKVMTVDAASNIISVSIPAPPASTPAGPPVPLKITAAPTTTFIRYSPDSPKTPVPSKFGDIQVGDQVKVIGERSADGASVSAQKVYSGAFRTVAATVTSIAPDGKSMTVKNLQTKQAVQVALNDDTVIRKLPQMMAMGLARRFNPDYKPTSTAGAGSSPAGAGSGAPASAGGASGGARHGSWGGDAAAGPGGMHSGGDAGGPGGMRGGGAGADGGSGGMRRAGGGDLSSILERAPKISATDLKPGDALVISGAADPQARIIAGNIIAGVEPIFQSAPPQSGRSLGDWNTLDMAAPTGQ